MATGGVKVSPVYIGCLASGHIARVAINELRYGWDWGALLSERMKRAEERLVELAGNLELDSLHSRMFEALAQEQEPMKGGRSATAV